MNLKDFGERIKDSRHQRDWTQEQLGARLGLTQSAVAQFEAGSRSPSLELLPTLAEALGVSLDYLVLGRERALLDLEKLSEADRHLIRRFFGFLSVEGPSGETLSPTEKKPKK